MDSSLVQRTLKACSLFAIATGTLDVVLGTDALSVAGAGPSAFPAASTSTAVTDSQIRFLGSTWAGWGVMLWWASGDLKGRSVPLALLGGIMLAGGVGRALSAMKHGFGAAWLQGAMWVELLGPGVLYALGRSQGVWS